MEKAKRLTLRLPLLIIFSVLCMESFGNTAMANNTREQLSSLNVGIASIISPNESTESSIETMRQLSSAVESSQQETEPEEESTLVMANISNVLNVRTEPSEDSDKAGVLYKDCGGRILEQQDGWTKIESGDLVGWAKDEYLLFGDEAKESAADVGVTIVSSNTDALRIRTEANEDAEVLGIITDEGFVEMAEDLGNGWISVVYNDEIGYVQSDYVQINFEIDSGETMAAIQAREEEKKKAALTANRGAVSADADELKLLAALIQCEAGNQSYEGKVAVGAVVMNRVKSGAYPSTIYDVIYASGQFTPALNGTVAKVYNSDRIADSCVQAAQAALNGETTVGAALHFRRAGNREGYVLGDHVFW
ncbi:MAG: cell wall hydrolase [Butyrivibrio sp.]|nr:cell wall hydrolase [Butyrivibrio sp.]